jgi:hypothetical protein
MRRLFAVCCFAVACADVVLAAPSLDLNFGNLIFGDVLVGSASAPHVVVAYNNGSEPLRFDGFSVTAGFSQTNSCPASLPSLSGCVITLQFTPATTGRKTGTLTIQHNGAGNPRLVTLEGTGVRSLPLEITPSSIVFPTPLLYGSSTTQKLVLKNTTSKRLTFNTMATSGDFVQVNTCGESLGSRASCEVEVIFSPRSSRLTSFHLVIGTSWSDGSATQFVPLSGWASCPRQVPVCEPVRTTFVTQGSSAGRNVVFVADESSPDLSYNWEFGDGATGGGHDVAHIYAQPGLYTVVLQITDGVAVARSSRQIEITAATPFPRRRIVRH